MAQKTTIMKANPLIRKIGTFESAASDGERVTYNGVLRKTLFFVALTVIGYALFFMIKNGFGGLFESIEETKFENGMAINFSVGSVLSLVGSLIICIAAPIIASVSPKLAPVFGGIYSVVQGMLIATITEIAASRGVIAEIGGGAIALIAFIATALIVLLMAVLYKYKVIKVTSRMKGILILTAGVFVLLTIAVTVMNFIPATHGLAAAFYNDPVLSVGCTILGIIFASLFLLSDFDTIDRAVENGLDKKYEWTTAFGLTLTILWLYLKVLELIIKILGSKK